MKYFKLIFIVTSFWVTTLNCWAMDVPDDETSVKTRIHTIHNMSEINKFLGEGSSGESIQKRARIDEPDPAKQKLAEGGDLSNTLFVFDFDETLAYISIPVLGPDFASKCRLFSCEIYREDEQAFQDAKDILQIPDFDKKKYAWDNRYFINSRYYALVEPSTADLLTNLRSRGATLLVCSGKINDYSRTAFLQSLGFNGTTDYFYAEDKANNLPAEDEENYLHEEDKAKCIEEYLKQRAFSKVIFMDNRYKNVKDFVEDLEVALNDTESQTKEIIGLHYKFFHSFTPDQLADQYRQIEEYIEPKRKESDVIEKLQQERLKTEGK